MSEYRVVSQFADLKDGKHIYEVGDKFPRLGVVISEKRLQELSTSSNKTGRPVIEEVFVKEAKEAVSNAEPPQDGAQAKEQAKPKRNRRKNAD